MPARTLVLGLLMSVACSWSPRARSAVFTNFDTGLDGWTHVGSGNLSHAASGGNPLGFARYDDVSGPGGDGFLIAPAKFLGDWSSLNGQGELRWNHRIVRLGDSPTVVASRARLLGPGGEAFYSGPSHTTAWTAFAVPIRSSSWTMVSGNWNSLLAQVSTLQIRIEAVHNGGAQLDIDGIDNVAIHLSSMSSLLADINGDCSVGVADYAIWAAQFGRRGVALTGDLDGNGEVGVGDYAIWAASFGNTCSSDATLVAEPSVSVLVVAACALIGLFGSSKTRGRVPVLNT